MPIARVVDLSHHQAYPQFGLLKQNGVEAAIFKATQGTSYVDDTFVDKVTRAQKSGLLVGAYHFMTGDDALAQWKHFLSVIKDFRPLVIALDYENNPQGADPTSGILSTMVNLAIKDLGRHPLLYGSNLLCDALRKRSCPEHVFQCPRWLARYGPKKPSLPCDLWQFTSAARIGSQGPYDASDLVNVKYATVADFWKRQAI